MKIPYNFQNDKLNLSGISMQTISSLGFKEIKVIEENNIEKFKFTKRRVT